MKLFQKPIVMAALLFTTMPALACITCDRKIRDGIFNSAFGKNVVLMVLPFAALGGLVFLLSRLASRQHNRRAASVAAPKSPVPLFATSLILGIGIGGFIDGIVLHQILQWHEMISATLPPTNYIAKSVNMFWDGIFHAVTLLVVLVGIVRLWTLLHRSDVDRSGNILAGGLIAGWGLFNIVEGVFDHHVLKLHNVRDVTPDKDFWNYGFLIFSIVLLVVGYVVARTKQNAT